MIIDIHPLFILSLSLFSLVFSAFRGLSLSLLLSWYLELLSPSFSLSFYIFIFLYLALVYTVFRILSILLIFPISLLSISLPPSLHLSISPSLPLALPLVLAPAGAARLVGGAHGFACKRNSGTSRTERIRLREPLPYSALSPQLTPRLLLAL